ncbi:MAG: TldD/PmbA family protein [Candidatus Helarchaeota archaeon]
MDYMKYGQKCLEMAEKEGVDHAEIYIANIKSFAATIEKGSIKSAQTLNDHGISIRTIHNGSVGFSFSTDFTWEALRNMVFTAIKLSKTGIPDPDFRDLARPGSYPTIKGTFDQKIADLEIDMALDYCLRTASAAELDAKITAINVDFDCSVGEEYLLNTNGIELTAKGTGVRLTAETTAEEQDERSSGYEFQASRYLKEINPEVIGQSAAKIALQSLHTKNIETGTYPVIIHPFAAGVFLGRGIGAAVDAEAIQHQRSYLSNLKDQEIGATLLNVIDNGIYIQKNGIAGLETAEFDGEGVPRQKTVLVSKGILRNFLYDTYTAGKDKCESTGNASRFSYKSIPSIKPSNLQVIGNHGNMESFITEVEQGLLLYYTWDHPNIATGDFSGLISLGFKIEHGEIAYPLKKAMFGINLLDFFKQIIEIGTDYRQINNLIIPSLYVADIRIAGAN